MSVAPPPLLASLRARSEALRVAELSARRSAADDVRDVDRRLQAAFRWLDEAQGHLGVIRPAVGHRFVLDSVLTIAALRYAGGFVSCRRGRVAGQDVVLRVEFCYRLANDAPIRVVVPRGAAGVLDARLRAARLEFDYRAERGDARCAVFTVTQAVAASVRFVADYGRRIVVATLDNVDRLETVVLEFAPEALGEPALEDLVRLMLGETDAFLKRAPLAGIRRQP
jgi:hypothetical protein